MRKTITSCWVVMLALGCSGDPGWSGSVASDESALPGAEPGATPGVGPSGLPGGVASNPSPDGVATDPGAVVTSPAASGVTDQTDPSTSGSVSPSPSTNTPVVAVCSDGVGAPSLHRLTVRELENTLTDAFGSQVALSLPQDPNNSYGFATTASSLLFSSNLLDQLTSQVRTLIAGLDLGGVRQRHGSCSASPACDEATVLAFTTTLLRRPLSNDETTRYTELWNQLSVLVGADDALRGSLEAATLSPGALYRAELGEAAADANVERTLNAYEVASAIAYTFAASAPDAELLRAASSGALDDPEVRKAHALRLLGTERGRVQMLDFFGQWWRYGETGFLAKDGATYPAFTPSIQKQLVAETDRFVLDVLTSGGTLADLLLRRDTFLGPELAAYYDLAATTDQVARYTRLEGHGVGLLAQGSVLARWALPNGSSPTQRGAFIRRGLLCEPLPAPPPNIAQIPEPADDITTRARYESVHAVEPTCAACHQLTDQVGFAFEHFDGAGQYRQTEHGLEIDASGELVGRKLEFDGQEQLAQTLAAMPEVRGCLAQHWVSFAFGVNPEQAKALADERRCAYEQTPGSLSDLFAGYAASSHFARRTIPL